MVRTTALALACLAAQPAAAQMEEMMLATNIGSVIGSEKACGLTFDQAAIAAYVAANTPKGNLGFANTLTMMTQGTEFNLQSLSPSALTAHCAAITASATEMGFIK